MLLFYFFAKQNWEQSPYFPYSQISHMFNLGGFVYFFFLLLKGLILLVLYLITVYRACVQETGGNLILPMSKEGLGYPTHTLSHR